MSYRSSFPSTSSRRGRRFAHGAGALATLTLASCAPAAAGSQVPAARTGAPASPWTVAAPAPAGFDRGSAAAATRIHLERMIALDTQNPPGNEALTAAYLDSVFRTVTGVETRIVEAAPGRAHFVARLRAPRGTQRPLVVMGHMDVVGVDTARWETPPFVATERDGYLYGRGTIDDKGMLAATVAAMTQLSARRDRMTRDVILLATADEEGGSGVGINWFLEHHAALLDNAEFALNEGGRMRVQDGRLRTVNVQTTEKVYHEVIARAQGPSGHGSVPIPDNALAALARAVQRVHAWQPPVRLNETTRIYFERLARIEEDSAMRAAMQRISTAGADSATIEAAAAVLSRDPLHSAVLRTGAALTIVSGGIRANVIPGEGSATFNVRTTPGEDIHAIIAEMNRIGGEPQVRFELSGEPEPSPPPSPVTTALYQAMERVATTMAPGTLVVPFMSTGATDGAALRAHGIPTYGILPLPMEMEDELRMHGDNERVPIPALGWAAEYLYRVMLDVSAR